MKESLREQHQMLLNPDSYPVPTGPIDYLETHVSRLYFTDNHVYKVKKPVNFGFLDFSTLEKRHHYCQEELTLNQRFCPDTYLKLITIRKNHSGYHIGGDGEIVDYAVLMKKLPAEMMLSQRLNAQDPNLPETIPALGRRIAELHRNSQICRDNTPSHYETLFENWKENFFQTAHYSGIFICAQGLELLSEYVKEFLENNRTLIENRETEGYVRDLHGDLHTENICLTDPIRIYDCIEFNQRFRISDTAGDIAFLLMDLDLRNRRDLSNLLLKSYSNELDKGEGFDTLIPFYKIYRAYVRAKVEALLSEDEEAHPKVREEAATKSAQYFNLSLSYLCPPLLIATCGLMGVGKSSIAKRLSESLGAIHLRSDEVRKELAGDPGKGAEESFEEGIYRQDFTRKTYDTLVTKALPHLRKGNTVVLDASFIKEEQRSLALKASELAEVPLLFVELECSLSLNMERLDKRQAEGKDISDGRRELLLDQRNRQEPLSGATPFITIDTSESIDYNVNLILCEIASLRKSG